jgi:hypothetical protein
LNWDLWLGTAPQRPFSNVKPKPNADRGYYHPFNWRGWWDFGTGALGDMGCHTANLPFMALNLGHPSAIQAESEEINPETYPAWARVKFDFPSRGDMPPVKVSWYEGRKDGVLVHPPEELVAKVVAAYKAAKAAKDYKGVRGDWKNNKEKTAPSGLTLSGSIIVGSKGMLYSPHDYGGEWWLLPHESFGSYESPAKILPRGIGGDPGMKAEWLAAIRGDGKPRSNFDYAGMLTEFILLGNVAIRAAGKRLEWDGPGMKFPTAPEAAAWLQREYRKPWTV